MNGTYSILQIGWSGMVAGRLAGNVASHNVANAATPGYSRQRAELAARWPWPGVPGMIGTGVEVLGVGQLRDALVEGRLRGALAEQGFSSGMSQVLATAQTAMGVGQDDALQQALGEFFSSLADLAADPAGAAARQQVLASAARVGTAFSSLRGHLQETRAGLDTQIDGLVNEVQQRLDEIAALNKEIHLAESAGARANDLRDRRQLLANEVAERLSVRAFSDDEGNLNLMLAAGGVLVEGQQAAELNTVVDGSNDGLLAVDLQLASGASRRLDASAGGLLGGLLAARDGQLRDAVDGLDQLAFDLAGQVNTLHQAGFGLDGVSGRNLFAPPGTVEGAAAALTLDAAVAGNPDALAAAQDATALPGDNRVALALADLATNSFAGAGTRTPVQQVVALEEALGSALAGAERDVELHAARISQLTALRESVSGVSLEEEMIELTKAQRAFEAASKVIQAGDEMLETILSLR